MPLAASSAPAGHDVAATLHQAVQAAEALLADAQRAVAQRVMNDGRAIPRSFDREQRATHGLAWLATYLGVRGRLEQNRLLLWCVFLSFPLPFIAVLTGWYTAEVGRQPWVVYRVLRTADAMTPLLSSAPSTRSSSLSAFFTSTGSCGLARPDI